MADPGEVTAPASSTMAQVIRDLINEARGQAVTYFESIPPGPASLVVTLTTDTDIGTVALGQWTFIRDADGTVHTPYLEAPGD